jgi:hypothetical protein
VKFLAVEKKIGVWSCGLAENLGNVLPKAVSQLVATGKMSLVAEEKQRSICTSINR